MTHDIEVERALSLWQPWAWAVASGHKRIENRTWRSKDVVGTWIAIHAGLKIDQLAMDDVRRITGEEPTLVHGVIVAVAHVAALIPSGAGVEALDPADRRWFNGPWGWFFDEVVELSTPVKCRGYQSLWHLSPEPRHQVQEMLRG